MVSSGIQRYTTTRRPATKLFMHAAPSSYARRDHALRHLLLLLAAAATCLTDKHSPRMSDTAEAGLHSSQGLLPHGGSHVQTNKQVLWLRKRAPRHTQRNHPAWPPRSPHPLHSTNYLKAGAAAVRLTCSRTATPPPRPWPAQAADPWRCSAASPPSTPAPRQHPPPPSQLDAHASHNSARGTDAVRRTHAAAHRSGRSTAIA